MESELNVLGRRILRQVRTPLYIVAICMLLYAAFIPPGRVLASNPTAGSISATVGSSVTWLGTASGAPPAANGEPTCTTGDASATNCDVYVLTVNPGSWAGKGIRVKLGWGLVSTDYDLVVRREDNGVAGFQGDGATSTPPLDSIVATSAQGTTVSEEVILQPPDTGATYYVRALYFAPNAADQYTGTASVESNAGVAAPTPTPGTLVAPTFDNYQPLDPAYPRRDDSPEPSIGVDWNTGNVMTMSRLQCNRTTFDDSTSPADPVTGASWFAAPLPAAVTGLDPILFTDSVTGRTICGELQGAGGATNGIITDDDLSTATPEFASGGTNGQDHQTFGSGPPKPGITGREPTGTDPHVWYYASQAVATATVATSLDGGVNFLPAVPAYTLNQCGGIHGHIKVGPDGTVYLPNKGCGGKVGVVVSEDNGQTWTVRTIPSSSSGGCDPSIGIGAGGRLYVGYTSSSKHPHVAVSDDKGLTWHSDFDFATNISPALTASVFPQAVAGDNDRAAVFFLGTSSTNSGDPTGTDNGGAGPNFAGTWYPYIATTVDGGKSWTVVRADNDPLHPGVRNPAQQGVICTNGTTCPGPTTSPGTVDTRNLADFNEISVDSAGRITAVYADGCNFDHACINIPENDPSATRINNQGVARLTIIRQRGGVRLFRTFDPSKTTPAIPDPTFVEAAPTTSGVRVLWGTPDDHGAPITNYRVYRSRVGKPAQLVTTVSGSTNTFVDRTGTSADRYNVRAVNKNGEAKPGTKPATKPKRRAARKQGGTGR